MFQLSPGIELIYSEDKQKLLGLQTSDPNEQLTFSTPIPSGQENSTKLALEESRNTMKVKGKLAYEAYQKEKDITKLVADKEIPNQLHVIMAYNSWTEEIEKVKGEKVGVQQYLEVLEKEITSLTKLVHKKQEDYIETRVCNILTVKLHLRDVIQDMMDMEVLNITYTKEWNYDHLRTYYKDEKFHHCLAGTKLLYNYHYIGTHRNLVITPLTCKAYVFFAENRAKYLPSCLRGPAGTGKTESAKDFANLCGVQSVVINCSGEMDVKEMATYLDQAFECGVQLIFDEFNRVQVAVLDQFTKDVDRIVKEWKAGKGNKMFYMVTTMNPGYAGRTVLPLELDRLNKSMDFIVPDVNTIMMVMFQSVGILKGKELGKKMVGLVQDLKHLLSKQYYYDFGLRQLKMMQRVCKDEIQSTEGFDDKEVILKAIQHVLANRVVDKDREEFEKHLLNRFQSKLPSVITEEFRKKVQAACEEMKLDFSELLVENVCKLNIACKYRHGIAAAGEKGCGKTTVIRVLAKVRGAEIDQLDWDPLSVEEIYGEFIGQMKDYKLGVLTEKFSQMANKCSVDQKERWLFINGELGAVKGEMLNTVLDDNKKLMLPNKEVISLPSQMRMVFEDNFSQSSPAQVSRLGVIYVKKE